MGHETYAPFLLDLDMNIEDIFIGAWVYVTNLPEVGQKTAVKVLGINTCKGCVRCEYNGITTWVWMERLEPIPLTAEILEKNGFVYDDTPFIQAWTQFGLSIYGGYGYYRINCGQNVAMDVRSVHLLQLALRLSEIEKQITL